MRAWLFFCGVAAAALLGGGCGSGPRVHDVTGEVTFDGTPVPDGDIVFVPEDKSLGADAGKIQGGRYTARVKQGRHRVEVRATRTVPGKKGPLGEPYVEDYIPPVYNDKTKLAADVGPGKTTFDYPLTSR